MKRDRFEKERNTFVALTMLTVFFCAVMPRQQLHAQDAMRLTRANGRADNAYVGASIMLPESFVVEARLQTRFDTLYRMLGVISYGFWDPQTRDTITIAIYPGGQWGRLDSLSWNRHAENAVKLGLRSYPGGEVVDNLVDWRPDTAMYRVVLNDKNHGKYQKSECKGSSGGRERSAVVCVNYLSNDPERGDDVLRGFWLTVPSEPLRRGGVK